MFYCKTWTSGQYLNQTDQTDVCCFTVQVTNETNDAAKVAPDCLKAKKAKLQQWPGRSFTWIQLKWISFAGGENSPKSRRACLISHLLAFYLMGRNPVLQHNVDCVPWDSSIGSALVNLGNRTVCLNTRSHCWQSPPPGECNSFTQCLIKTTQTLETAHLFWCLRDARMHGHPLNLHWTKLSPSFVFCRFT